MNDEDSAYNFFILYEVDNDQDERYARKILDFLETEHNLRGYVEFRDAAAGLSVFKNFENALKNSKFVLLLISMESIKDGWWDRQMETTLYHHINNVCQESVVPIYLPNLKIEELPASLSIFAGVSYSSDPNNRFWRKLAQVFQ